MPKQPIFQVLQGYNRIVNQGSTEEIGHNLLLNSSVILCRMDRVK